MQGLTEAEIYGMMTIAVSIGTILFASIYGVLLMVARQADLKRGETPRVRAPVFLALVAHGSLPLLGVLFAHRGMVSTGTLLAFCSMGLTLVLLMLSPRLLGWAFRR